MTSDGERIEGHVQLLRVLMTRDGWTIDEALAAREMDSGTKGARCTKDLLLLADALLS